MPGNQSINSVTDRRGNKPGYAKHAPGPAEVRRNSQRRIRVREDSLLIRGICRFDEQHRIEPAHFRMSLEDFASSGAVERRELQSTRTIARENELHALGAKAAGPVVQKNWRGQGRTHARGVIR